MDEGLSMMLHGPVGVFEAMGQSIMDTYDEEGISYAIGNAAPDIVIEIVAAKGAGLAMRGTARTADVTGDLAGGARLLDVVEYTANGAKLLDVVEDTVSGAQIVDKTTDTIQAAHYAEGVLNKTDDLGSVGILDDVITDGSHLENGRLKPNITYKTGEHNYIYKTNEDGLIVNASTDNLQLKTHEGRLNHNTNTYGKETGDHAGHLFGDGFGGSPELGNLVSQAQRVNLSEYKVIENQWVRALENGDKVMVDITINYDVGVFVRCHLMYHIR